MSIIRAVLVWLVLEFVTILSYFLLASHVIDIITAIMNTQSSYAEIVALRNNIILGINGVFFFFVILWTIWLAYVAHAQEHEATYQRYYGGRNL